MASLRFETDRNRKGWRLQFYTLDKRKRSLWIGDVSKKKARDIQRFVEDLLTAKSLGRKPDGDAALWAQNLEGRMRDSLVKCGLCKPAEPKRTDAAANYLGAFIDHYLELRTDFKDLTRTNFKQVRDWAVAYFGEQRGLETITRGDFEQWIRWMRNEKPAASGKKKTKCLSAATANKHAKRLRQMFEFAVKSRLLKENPGAGCKLGLEVNSKRQFFVTRTMAKTVLDKCGDVHWKLIFALPRFAGLRCPTEVLGLTWADVDWERGRLRIDSVKTGLRFCPIFPDLRPILEEAFNLAAQESPTGQPARDARVVNRFGSNSSNLRTQMNELISTAGLKPWEKTFVNLRASCRTELEERFPSHVVNAWLGHSTQIAEKHYLQLTDEHWQRATEPVGGSIGGSTGGDVPASQQSPQVTKPKEKQLLATAGESSPQEGYPLGESKILQNARETAASGAAAVLPAVTFGEIPDAETPSPGRQSSSNGSRSACFDPGAEAIRAAAIGALHAWPLAERLLLLLGPGSDLTESQRKRIDAGLRRLCETVAGLNR